MRRNKTKPREKTEMKHKIDENDRGDWANLNMS